MNHLRESFLPGLARIFALEEDISAEWSKSSFRDLYALNGALSIKEEMKAVLWWLYINNLLTSTVLVVREMLNRGLAVLTKRLVRKNMKTIDNQ
jgi:hypothetical protein